MSPTDVLVNVIDYSRDQKFPKNKFICLGFRGCLGRDMWFTGDLVHLPLVQPAGDYEQIIFRRYCLYDSVLCSMPR